MFDAFIWLNLPTYCTIENKNRALLCELQIVSENVVYLLLVVLSNIQKIVVMKILIVLLLCIGIYSCGGSDKQNQPQNNVESPKEEVVSSTSKPEKSIDDGNIYYKIDSVGKSKNKTVLFIRTQFPYKEDVIRKIADEMYNKSNNKKLTVRFYLKNRNEFSDSYAKVYFENSKSTVYYPRMYPEKLDVSKINGKIIGAWYNDITYSIDVFVKNKSGYQIQVYSNILNPSEFYAVKLKSKSSNETVFEEDRSGSSIKGLIYKIKENKELEVTSQTSNSTWGVFSLVNLDSIKVK